MRTRLQSWLAAALLIVPAGAAKADAARFAAIEVAVAKDAEPEVLAQLALGLGGQLPPAPKPVEGAETFGPAVVSKGEIQAALTQLAILSGTNGHLTLQLAQLGREDVIYVQSGQARLSDLTGDPTLISQTGNLWRLNRPLVIWPGASLVIAPGEVLEMDTAQGAFILSFGTVEITDANLRSVGADNAGVPTFRPFLLVTGQGRLQAHNAQFESLGFRGPVAFRGVSVLTGGVMKSIAPSLITASRFADTHSLSLEGTDDAVIRDNRFEAALSTAISVTGGTGITLSGNRILDTVDGAGVRLSGVLNGIALSGNLVADGGRNGIQIDGQSRGLTLIGNAIIGNKGAGITISQSLCLTVQGNIIASNATAGLRLSDSGAARINGNAIYSNGSAGIELLSQTGLPPIAVTANALRHNREGLSAAGIAEVQLGGNDLAQQIPRQFAGDFAPWLAAYLSTGSADQAFVIPAAAGVAARPAAPCETE
ncbi:right-handed parallel beta-helix repeat-containing protein [Tabrizicola sp.]|uniref:right-handed parallel beta-helix repeat-containing protein n=1 Tax=Tabrizicola sp. TaxID=2005166 RepID=UPI00286AAAEC|nr:right-handed parallel beta-helix repeat-containing protein [Tabrizicola sp.]